MNMEKDTLEQTFEKHREFHGRDERGIITDKIYCGLFEATLLNNFGYNQLQLKEAAENNWIKKTWIEVDNKGIQNAYLWLGEEMPQRGWKMYVDKVYRFIKGDYQRYYGKKSH